MSRTGTSTVGPGDVDLVTEGGVDRVRVLEGHHLHSKPLLRLPACHSQARPMGSEHMSVVRVRGYLAVH